MKAVGPNLLALYLTVLFHNSKRKFSRTRVLYGSRCMLPILLLLQFPNAVSTIKDTMRSRLDLMMLVSYVVERL